MIRMEKLPETEAEFREAKPEQTSKQQQKEGKDFVGNYWQSTSRAWRNY